MKHTPIPALFRVHEPPTNGTATSAAAAKSTKYLDTGAQLSPCEKYRYTLWRVWDEARPHVAFVGLNPSTADATQDDPTIRRCVRFADDHGFGAFTMLNLWAFRATDPSELTGCVTPEEGVNFETFLRVTANVARVCAVWGSHPMARARYMAMWPHVGVWHRLGKTKDGHPRHPLYLRADSKMERWTQ